MYTIVDIETSGPGNKITEISIFKHDGLQIIEEFTSLVNPETYIPDYITALTGIDNYMVAKAPIFSAVAQAILDITEETIFVAHSVNFDYNAIRNEFKAIGIDLLFIFFRKESWNFYSHVVVARSAETVEKPRGVLAVKKTAFENAPGATFSNRALWFDTLNLIIELSKGLFRQSQKLSELWLCFFITLS